MDKNKKETAKVKKISFIKKASFALTAGVLFNIVGLFMHSRTHGREILKNIKEPCLILSTHGSIFDVAYGGRAVIPKYYTGVVAKNLFYLPVIGKLLGLFGFISKKQFAVDVNCIKSIKNNLENGVSVYICPEGKISADGRQNYIPPAIAKLIKWLGAPVVFIGIKGSCLAFPRWNMKPRKGKISADVSLLFSREEIASSDSDAIYGKLLNAFEFNDHEYQQKNNIKFKTKAPAAGLHRLLYKCPKCGEEFAMTAEKDKITCGVCGNAAKIDTLGHISPVTPDGIVFDRIDRWADFEKEALKTECENDGYTLSANTVFLCEDSETKKYIRTAKGVLTLNKEGLRFEPAEYIIAGEDAKKASEGLFYALENIPTVSFTNKAINMGINNTLHSYEFEYDNMTFKWNYAIETLYNKIYGTCIDE